VPFLSCLCRRQVAHGPEWCAVLLGHLCVNLPLLVEGAGVPVDRRAACMDMHDSKKSLDPLLDVDVVGFVAIWLYRKLNPCVERALYDALFLAIV
jgi:hypothetical protein